MIKFIDKKSDIKKSNVFFLAEEESCLTRIEFLNLPEKIIRNMKKIISENETKSREYFIDNNEVEVFYFLYIKNKEEREKHLGEAIEKLPEKFIVIPNKEKNGELLLTYTVLRKYTYSLYKSEKKEMKMSFFVENKGQKHLLEERMKTLENIILARDLGNAPASYLTPEKFAEIIKETDFKGTKVTVFSYKEIKKMGMGLLEGVGKGSIHKPCFVLLEKIKDKKLPSIGVVGKGLVFDTGGLNIKTKMMYEMKADMCGAGAVFALMKELDRKDLNCNIIAGIPLADNAVSGESFRPSDILTSYIGKTVNIINTDAEGRLVLADAVGYLSKNYSLSTVISVATLTGACLFSLGYRYAGIMGTEKKMMKDFIEGAEETGEKYVEFPFDSYFMEKTKSSIADLENLSSGTYAMPSMGGAFIAQFLTKGEKFVHLDIAGTADNNYEAYGICPKGATGFGVESLSFILQNIKG